MSAILFPKCDCLPDSSRVLVVLWKCLRASCGSGGVFSPSGALFWRAGMPDNFPPKSQISQNTYPGLEKYRGALIRRPLFKKTPIYVDSYKGIPLYRDALCRGTSIWESPI